MKTQPVKSSFVKSGSLIKINLNTISAVKSEDIQLKYSENSIRKKFKQSEVKIN